MTEEVQPAEAPSEFVPEHVKALRAFYDALVARGQIPPHQDGYPPELK